MVIRRQPGGNNLSNIKTIDQLIQEYEASGGIVDRGQEQNTAPLSPSVNVSSSALSGYPIFNLTVPNISYTPPSMEELLLEAQQLYSGGYNRQTQAAQKAYQNALTDLQKTYAQNRQNVENAATARGFGRSTYVTDALAGLGKEEALTQERNAEALLQQLNSLGYDMENQIAAYASQQYRAAQEKAYETELLKAQLQMELDKLGYNANVNRFLYEQEHPNIYKTDSGSGSSGDKTVLHDSGTNIRPKVIATDNPALTGPAMTDEEYAEYMYGVSAKPKASSGGSSSGGSGSGSSSTSSSANRNTNTPVSVQDYINSLSGKSVFTLTK